MNPRVWKDTITIYNHYRDPITKNITYIRTVLERNFWDEQSISTRQKGGISIPEEVTLYVPWNDRYLRPEDFARLDKHELPNHWTIALGADLQATRILHFNCPFEFTLADEETFTRNQLRRFEGDFSGQIHIAQDENPQLFGSQNLWHIVVRC